MDELEKIRRVSAALSELYWYDINGDKVAFPEHVDDLVSELGHVGLKIVEID